jgi:hypothetical protein
MVDFPKMGNAARGMGKLGETLKDIGDRMQNAEEVQDFSTAMVKSVKGLADIHRDIRDDPRFADSSVEDIEEEFNNRAVDLSGNISDGMKYARSKTMFSKKFKEDQLQGLLKMRDFGRQRFISRSRAKTEEELQVLSDSLIETGSIDSLSSGQAIIDGKVAAGIFSPEEGGQLSEKFKRNAVIGYYERLIENPSTSVAAFNALGSDPEPKILSMVDERTKSALLEKARNAAKKQINTSYETAVLKDVQSRFKNDPLKAIAHLENPNNFKELSLEGRSKVISFLYSVENRKRLMEEAQRKEQANADLTGIYSSLLKNETDKAIIGVASSKALTPNQKMDLYDKIIKYPWKTNPGVYSDAINKIHAGMIKDTDQIDRLRGRGLSNEDADKLQGKLKAPRYKTALKYAETAYKLIYPKKDDLEKHVKYLEFVQQIDDDITTLNGERAKAGKPPMTEQEAREVVDAYLEKTEEVEKFLGIDMLWPDKSTRPVEKWLEGKSPFGSGDKPDRPQIPSHERIRLNTIPRDAQERIADVLYDQGYRVNADNIEKFYKLNRDRFDQAGQSFKVNQGGE